MSTTTWIVLFISKQGEAVWCGNATSDRPTCVGDLKWQLWNLITRLNGQTDQCTLSFPTILRFSWKFFFFSTWLFKIVWMEWKRVKFSNSRSDQSWLGWSHLTPRLWYLDFENYTHVHMHEVGCWVAWFLHKIDGKVKYAFREFVNKFHGFSTPNCVEFEKSCCVAPMFNGSVVSDVENASRRDKGVTCQSLIESFL